jgi:hypothetical protein
MFTTLTEMFDAAYDGSIAGRTVSAELAAMFECYGGCWVVEDWDGLEIEINISTRTILGTTKWGC